MNHSPVIFGLAALTFFAAASHAADDGIEFFEKRVRPVLSEHCGKCHASDSEKIKGGLLLDSRDGWLKGGDSGPALVPGDPENSLLIKAVRHTDNDLKMPSKDKRLPDAVIADLVAWVQMGAPSPQGGKPEIRTSKPETKKIDYDAARKLWAFHKPERPVVPEPGTSNAQRPTSNVQVSNPIDHFILAKLGEKGLAPAPPAGPRTLIRRMTFDLTGLPPTPEETDAFTRDWPAGEDASAIGNRKSRIENLITRLLASPAYGEQWGRHWLDTVRYADSLDARGVGKEGDLLDAWRYRDWVVGAFNRDLPYDQFVTHQLAGDILAAREWDAAKVTATGMYAIGNWGNGDADKEKVYTDIVDDQIDVTGRAFLGLTLACARCHDHKFDPLTARDYYGMAGVFFSSRILAKFQGKGDGEKLARWPLLSPAQAAERAAAQKRIAEIDAQLTGGLQPLTVVKRDIFNKPGLHAWNPKGADNPSLVINTTDAEQSFITIKLPAKSIALHPGPKTAASVAWRSPVTGTVRVSARLRDADPNCGDGIAWEVRRAGEKLGGGTMDNGGTAEFAEREITVKAGELVQLIIRPRGEYTCDSTQTDFIVRGADGAEWDLRDALVRGAAQGQDDIWWVCAGEGAQLGGDVEGRPALEEEKKTLAGKVAGAEFVQGLQEGGIPATKYDGFHDAQIHTRGRYDRLGDTVPRAFPALLTGEQPPIAAGSGRMELARWIASAENPLTARVMVNRIWQHHFGEGIVRTPNNFGKLGTPPTHPELLDWLATEFVKSGWSVKAIHRLILTSATYQQSSTAAPAARKADADNQLFTRQNRRRLSAEELRDSLLATTGALDRTVGGASLRDLAAPRRTLYITTIRSDRATYQMLFDGADPSAIVEKRTDSVVAPQALWLLNHPFALAQTKALAARLLRETPDDDTARIAWLYARLFARPPVAEETQIALAALARGKTDAPAAWEQLCQVLLCTNEFVYLD